MMPMARTLCRDARCREAGADGAEEREAEASEAEAREGRGERDGGRDAEEPVEQRALSTGMETVRPTVVSKAAVEPMMMRTSDVVQAQLVMKRGFVHLGVDSLRTKGKGRMMWSRRRHGGPMCSGALTAVHAWSGICSLEMRWVRRGKHTFGSVPRHRGCQP